MPQKPLDASDETVRLTLRLTKRMTHEIDLLRKDTSRSEYVRTLIEAAVGLLAEPTLGEPSRKIKVVPESDHRCRFVKGDVVGYVQGRKVYRKTCSCGETKEEE